MTTFKVPKNDYVKEFNLKDAVFDLYLSKNSNLRPVNSSNSLDTSATNIADALLYTSTLFKDDVIKRIVIISDGKETKQSNIVSIVEK